MLLSQQRNRPSPKRVVQVSFLLIAVLILYPSCHAGEHPNMFLNRDDIERIKHSVASGEEPWRTAFSRLIEDANTALEDTIRSVVHTVPKDRRYSVHAFVTDKPYSQTDGVIDSTVDRGDYVGAIHTSRSVRDLGLAYALTGESRYAKKAIELLNGWCVTPSTRMLPRFTNSQSRIELSITIPGMLYGADLIYNVPEWPRDERDAFFRWVDTLATAATGWTAKNNFDSWRLVLIAAAGALLDKREYLQVAVAGFKHNVNAMIVGDRAPKGFVAGQLPAERGRTRSLFYSLYALNAMVQVADIAGRRGLENLFDYRGSQERSLKLALDYHAPYAADPDAWPYEEIIEFKGENCALFEIAYSYWKDPTFKSVIDRWQRPMYEERIMGHITLTHGIP